jgi:hypothetical protein
VVIKYREYWFPMALAVFFSVVGSFPYVYGYASAEPGEHFMGFVGRDTPGANGYFMFARQVQLDGNFMQNKMTSEPLPDNYFNLEWWLFGKSARWTGLSLIAMFHVWRVLTVFGFMWTFYFLARLCLDRVGERRLALSLVVFGGGFGWMIWLANRAAGLHLALPLDLDGVGIPGYLINKPHFIRAGICTLLTYGFLILGERTGKRRYFAYSGLAALIHTAIRPYHLPETYLVYLVFPLILSWREGRISRARVLNYGLAGLMLLPGVLDIAFMAWQNTLGMAGWYRQSLFLLQQVLWLGWPFALVCIAFVFSGFTPERIRTARESTILLCLWLTIAWLLVNAFPYFPAGHELAFYPLVLVPPILVFRTAFPLIRDWAAAHPAGLRPLNGLNLSSPRLLRTGVAFLVLVSLPSTAYVYRSFFTGLHRETGAGPWRTFYLTDDEYQTLDWMHKTISPQAVVLASLETSQFIPRVSGQKVLSGHDMLTAYYDRKNAEVQKFFALRGDDQFKREMIKYYHVDYVLYGPDERRLGEMRPEQYPWMKKVYQHGDVTLYRIVG